MKKTLTLSLAIIVCFCAFTSYQVTEMPSVILTKIDGTKINSNTFLNKGKPMIISFWATWCVPCKKELDAIHKNYAEWQKETGVKLIAISIDDSLRALKIGQDVIAKGWNYEVYIDYKQEFKKAMNVTNVPYTFLLDGKGKVVWIHDSYKAGDEIELYEKVKKIVKGESLEEIKHNN